MAGAFRHQRHDYQKVRSTHNVSKRAPAALGSFSTHPLGDNKRSHRAQFLQWFTAVTRIQDSTLGQYDQHTRVLLDGCKDGESCNSAQFLS